MTTFDEREQGFEAKFAHDAELTFRVEARRNRLLGLWAADLLGLTGAEAADYATGVVKADFEEQGHEDVLRKVIADLAGKADEPTIRSKHADLLATARAQILDEG